MASTAVEPATQETPTEAGDKKRSGSETLERFGTMGGGRRTLRNASATTVLVRTKALSRCWSTAGILSTTSTTAPDYGNDVLTTYG